MSLSNQLKTSSIARIAGEGLFSMRVWIDSSLRMLSNAHFLVMVVGHHSPRVLRFDRTRLHLQRSDYTY